MLVWLTSLPVFSFIHYQNARKNGIFY